MLQNENDVGADLVTFGVRIREATDLMQRQILSAFDTPASESTVATRLERGAVREAGQSFMPLKLVAFVEKDTCCEDVKCFTHTHCYSPTGKNMLYP